MSCELTITTRRSYKLGNKEQHKEKNKVLVHFEQFLKPKDIKAFNKLVLRCKSGRQFHGVIFELCRPSLLISPNW